MILNHTSILIIGNRQAPLHLSEGRLAQLGYTSTRSEPGNALELARATPFDLFLLDLASPGAASSETLILQLKADATLKQTPLVLISDDVTAIEQGLVQGADDFLLDAESATLLETRLAANLERVRLSRSLKAANAETSRFVSEVSHEIKTPMTSIKGYADLLLMTAAADLKPAQLEFLQVIRENIGQMAKLVSDLTDIVKAEAGTLYLEPESVSVAMVVKSALEPFPATIKANHQTMSVEIPAGLPPVRAEWARVVQIVSELVDNACSYTPPDGQITVSAEAAGDMVRFMVRDTGCGIAEEHLLHVFDRFFSVKSKADAGKKSGPGLGLSLAKSLVEAQGGQIQLNSKPGHGTTVYFTVPIY